MRDSSRFIHHNNQIVIIITKGTKGLTSLMSVEADLAAWKNGVSQVYLKLPLFFSKEALYNLCEHRDETVIETLQTRQQIKEAKKLN